MRRFGFVLLLFAVFFSTVCGAPVQASAAVDAGGPTDMLVARLYYTSPAQLADLARTLDIWESHPDESLLVVYLSQAEVDELRSQGYRVELDAAKTALVNTPRVIMPGQVDGIPGYTCYRTVEETYAALQTLNSTYPDLVLLQDIGNSWDKATPGGPGGYDIQLIRLTNENFSPVEGKFIFFLMAEIHAREYVTAETATRLAEYLLGNYGIDPDITWLLDYGEIHIVPMTNPDGRKFAEAGNYWRKNTNTSNGCSYDYGVDLNRNSTFKWGDAGTDPCDETYQGPLADSEPETDVIQNYVRTIFPDQRGPLDNDPASADYQGLFITLHSYSELVLFPYGWGYAQAPNHTPLQTLARKMAFFNHYAPQKSSALYPASGTTDDWAYGELGVPAYTYEMGTSFFQSCSSFESSIWPNNRDSLLYSFKAARRPYQAPAGPEVINAAVTPANAMPSIAVTLTASADDRRYENSEGVEPSQNIVAARYSIDQPSWAVGTTFYEMQAADGSFNSSSEALTASVNTSGMLPGHHTLFVEAQDAAGNWGVPDAVFLQIDTPVAGYAQLTPAVSDLVGEPDSSAVYTLSLQNIGLALAIFDLTAAGSPAWPVAIDPPAVTLGANEGAEITVTVQIPAEAVGGASDSVQITASPQGAPEYADLASLTTYTNQTTLTPASDALSGAPGTQVIYSLTITSAANEPRTFDILPGAHTWPVSLSTKLISLLPGESKTLTVTVTIPADAPDAAIETLEVRAEMRADRRHVDVSLLTTTAALPPKLIFLPAILR